jgi:hypothetical protein
MQLGRYGYDSIVELRKDFVWQYPGLSAVTPPGVYAGFVAWFEVIRHEVEWTWTWAWVCLLRMRAQCLNRVSSLSRWSGNVQVECYQTNVLEFEEIE